MANLAKNLTGFTKVNNTLLKAVKTDVADKIEVEIGDSKQPDFKPQFKVSRWDNECNFSMRAEEDPTATVTVAGGIVKYKAKDYEVHQYEKQVEGENGHEFEWILPKKPKSNVLTATIQTKELDFFYQPALTEQEIAEGASRPDNIVGSYAVYHKTGRNNIVGGKEYKTGKAFHIYRPEAVDAVGARAWCELNLDDVAGVLTVTVPQKFIDTAVYPVVVDPTFGYTSQGASSRVITDMDFDGGVAQQGVAITGTLTTVSAYAKKSAGTINIVLHLYSETSSKPSTSLVAGSSQSVTTSYVLYNSSLSYSMVGANYWAVVNGSGGAPGTSGSIAWDSGSGSGALNSTGSWVANTNRYSVYATYTASGGGASTPTRMMMGIGS